MDIGIAGLGVRTKNLLRIMKNYEHDIRLKAIADINLDAVREDYYRHDYFPGAPTFYANIDEMLYNESLDAVMVCTRCYDHAKQGCQVLDKNMFLFKEKPLAINYEDLRILKEASKNAVKGGISALTLRFTPLVSKVKKILDSGHIGEICHVQYINNVPYGGVYYHRWYRDDSATGGMFLQKGIHDMDCINYLIGRKPVKISAVTSKQYYIGNKPSDLKCDECNEFRTCVESSYYLEQFAGEKARGNMCCFAVDTGNEDSSTAIMLYDNGMHTVYTQNFIAKKGAAYRGAWITGTRGTVVFEFFSETIKIYMHYMKQEEIIRFSEDLDTFFGGDVGLISNFINVLTGRQQSISTIEDGLDATYMAMKARESARIGKMTELNYSYDFKHDKI